MNAQRRKTCCAWRRSHDPCQHPAWRTRTARGVWALYWTESRRDFITAIQKSRRSFWRMSSTPRWRRTSSARYMTRWGRFWRCFLLYSSLFIKPNALFTVCHQRAAIALNVEMTFCRMSIIYKMYIFLNLYFILYRMFFMLFFIKC